MTQNPGNEEILDISLCYSNMNFPRKLVALGGSDQYQQFMEDVAPEASPVVFNGGYDITPTRRLMWDIDHGSFDPPLISRVHQTWPEYPWRDMQHATAPLNWAALVAMPETHRSLETARRLSSKLGDVALCVYPESVEPGKQSTDFWQYGRKNSAQIAPEAIAAAGSGNDMQALSDFLWNQGIPGVTLDSHHLAREGSPWKDWLSSLDASDAIIMGVHASAGRIDSKNHTDRERSLSELAAFLKGPEALGRTVMGEILSESYLLALAQRVDHLESAKDIPRTQQLDITNRENYKKSFYASMPWMLPVTLEVPYGGIEAVRQEPLSVQDFTSITRDLGQCLQEFFSRHAGRL